MKLTQKGLSSHFAQNCAALFTHWEEHSPLAWHNRVMSKDWQNYSRWTFSTSSEFVLLQQEAALPQLTSHHWHHGKSNRQEVDCNRHLKGFILTKGWGKKSWELIWQLKGANVCLVPAWGREVGLPCLVLCSRLMSHSAAEPKLPPCGSCSGFQQL